MKTYQRGFASIILILVALGLIAIGGGVYYYQKISQNPLPSTQTNTMPQQETDKTDTNIDRTLQPETVAPKSLPSQAMLDSAAVLGEMSTKLMATCLPPAVVSELTTSTRAIEEKLRDGDIKGSLKDLGAFIGDVAEQANGYAPFVIDAGRISTKLLTGTSSEPVLIKDPRVASNSLRATISSSAMPQDVRDSLDSHLAKAIAAFNRGAANEERAELGIVARTILTTVADSKKLLTPAQATTMLVADISIIVYFDPVLIVATFRDNLAAGNLDAALAVMHPSKREATRSRLSQLTPEQLQALAAKFTTTLTLSSISGSFSQYDMMRGDKNYTHPIVFQVDCDGAWRISSY
jgi:hypothetical protein